MRKKIVGEYTWAVFSLPWLVARDEGLFAEEGLEVEIVEAGKVSRPPAPVVDLGLVDPMLGHDVYEKGVVQTYCACHWGNILRARESARGIKIVGKIASNAMQAIVVRGDSDIEYPEDLRNRPIGVTFHAGSHYMALQMLQGFLPKDDINLKHVGSDRYDALLRGEVDAVTLMEPWTSLAEKYGHRVIMESRYVSTDMASDDLDNETWAAVTRAIKRAVRRINADKKKYLHYFIKEIPPRLGTLTPDDFDLRRLRYIDPQPYTQEEFDVTNRWMQDWGLIRPGADFRTLVDNKV